MKSSAGKAEASRENENGTKSNKDGLISLFGEKLLDDEDAQAEQSESALAELLNITQSKQDPRYFGADDDDLLGL